jgi:hypothetical protein
MTASLASVVAALTDVGLAPRGAFHPDSDDGVPPLPDGRAAATMVLAGNAGPAMWQRFSVERQATDEPNGLDGWSKRVLNPLAKALGGHAIFPSDGPPYVPFQRWAQRAEPVYPSPIGPLIHPDFGLWHAYRGVLVFPEVFDLPAKDDRPSPCESCADKPCLETCPVGAMAPGGYNVPTCADHLAASDSAGCLSKSCAARRACPIGRDYTYDTAQSQFHMAAFIRALRPGNNP